MANVGRELGSELDGDPVISDAMIVGTLLGTGICVGTELGKSENVLLGIEPDSTKSVGTIEGVSDKMLLGEAEGTLVGKRLKAIEGSSEGLSGSVRVGAGVGSSVIRPIGSVSAVGDDSVGTELTKMAVGKRDGVLVEVVPAGLQQRRKFS